MEEKLRPHPLLSTNQCHQPVSHPKIPTHKQSSLVTQTGHHYWTGVWLPYISPLLVLTCIFVYFFSCLQMVNYGRRSNKKSTTCWNHKSWPMLNVTWEVPTYRALCSLIIYNKPLKLKIHRPKKLHNCKIERVSGISFFSSIAIGVLMWENYLVAEVGEQWG